MINSFIGAILEKFSENIKLERILILAIVDFKSRYYYHKLGILWALIRPLIELLTYYTVFVLAFKNNIEYFELYLFSGLLLWYFFLEGTNKSINILLSKRYLIESIPFNKIDLLISATISALMGFLFNFLAYFAISIIVGNPPTYAFFIFFPVLLLIMCMLVLGIGLILSTISIYLKDIQHLWDMLTLVGFWMLPIVYSEKIFVESMPIMLYLNPMAGLVINMHKILLYGTSPDFFLLSYNFGLSATILTIGMVAFSKYSHKAAEKI